MSETERYSDLDLDLELTPDGDLKKETNRESIKQSLRALMNTFPGERIYRPEFGCNIQQYLFQTLDNFTGDAIGNEILSSIERFESRIEVDEVNVNVNYGKQRYEVNVSYTIVNTGEIDTLNIFLEKM